MSNDSIQNNITGKIPENQTSKEVQGDVKSPLDLIMISYQDFVLQELENCDKEKLKRSIIRKIPDEVDRSTISNTLVEFEKSTYEFKPIGKDGKAIETNRVLNGVVKRAVKRKSFANNKSNEHGEATIEIQIETDKGTLTSPFVLTAEAKSKWQEFTKAINTASNYLITNGTDNTLRLFRELINKKCNKTVTLLSNPGSIEFEDLTGRIYKNCYTDGFDTYWADENGIIELPNGKKVALDNTAGSNQPMLYKDDIDIKACVSKLLESIDKAFKGKIEPFLALGLGIMGVFTEKLWKNTCGIPSAYLYGKSKQGKGTIQNLINYIYGFDKTFLAMGNSTYRAINRKCNAYNSCIVHLNDMTSNNIKTDWFENNIVQSYENITREKMKDGNKFNNLPQCSTLFISSNYLPAQKEKVLNRILPIYFEANIYNPKEMAKYYNEPTYLSKILPELLKFDFDDILKMIKECGKNLAIKSEIEESRETNNLAIAFVGLTLLEQLGDYSITDKEAKALEYFNWYLKQFKELEEPIDSFLNHLPTLLEEHVIDFEAYADFKKVDNRAILTIRTLGCIDKYNCFIGKVYPDKFILPKEFSVSAKNSPYYIATKNQRYKIKGKNRLSAVASSTVLDITEHYNADMIEELYFKLKSAKHVSTLMQ